jgi:ATP-dependent DNA helicase RecG
MPQLSDPVLYIKGVGPQLAEKLAKLNLLTMGDLLRHYPLRWEDRSRLPHIADVRPGDQVTLKGVVIAVTTRYTRQKMAITEALLDQEGSAIKLVWINQPFMERTFRALASTQRPVVVYGLIRRDSWSGSSYIYEIQNPEWEEIEEDSEALSTNRIVPIYPSTEGLNQKRLRKVIYSALQTYGSSMEETLPADILLRHNLLGLISAIQNIHFPETEPYRQAARRRLVFEEFFVLQTLLAQRRRALSHDVQGVVLKVDRQELANQLREIVPFELTGAQKRAISEIAANVSQGRAMNRLVQGDVGSGKTMVALAAILMAVQNGYQAALMAPTEILAQQHALGITRLLEPLGITAEVALGSLTQKQKGLLRGRLLSGETQVAIGTHALIQEGMEFANLGMVVVDEQHRFGVLQRQALSLKGARPHVLVMTATPIPRTLTMTLYGDLDVSVLDELPPGRKPIKTHWRTSDKRTTVYNGVQKMIDEGRQVYIVCPLVEESEKLQAKSATQLAEQIRTHIFPQYRVGLLHGQMRPDEKESVMAQFKAHELDILVSTTVIEVGIDVPNASVIVIEDAERFGLAQLHQLRGRVGRGKHASYCILIADPKTEEGQSRMGIMTETQDGFRIAEEDLRLRGPGEFFGTRQSGLPELTIADIFYDMDILAETRESAFHIVEADPRLTRPEHRPLQHAVARLKENLGTVTVG